MTLNNGFYSRYFFVIIANVCKCRRIFLLGKVIRIYCLKIYQRELLKTFANVVKNQTFKTDYKLKNVNKCTFPEEKCAFCENVCRSLCCKMLMSNI